MEGTKLGPTTGCGDSVLSQTKPSSQSLQCFSMKALSTPLLPTVTTAPPPHPKDDCHPAGGLCLLVFLVGSYLFVLRPSQLCPGRANDCCGTPLLLRLLRWRHRFPMCTLHSSNFSCLLNQTRKGYINIQRIHQYMNIYVFIGPESDHWGALSLTH